MHTLRAKLVASAGFGLVALIFRVIAVYQQPIAAPLTPGRNLTSLPEDLTTLQAATGYPRWDRVQGYSRALTHHRQLRFQQNMNVFVSETGATTGQVDVVEVILMPSDPSKKVEFALYDPKSGKRISNYPDSIKFDVLGIPGGSRNPAPDLCLACHIESLPLVALVPWSQTLEDDLKRSRATGQGIRPDLMVPVPDDEATRNRMIDFNRIMQHRFSAQISDIRNWMSIRTRHGAERDGATNGSQQFRSETNRTSPAAGSRR